MVEAYLDFWEAAEMSGSKTVLDLAAWAARQLPMPVKRAHVPHSLRWQA